MRVGAADSQAPPGVSAHRRRRQGRRWPGWLRALTFGLSILLTAAVVSALILGSSYQPVASGGAGARVAGQIVSQRTNDLPPMAGQIYLPPQKAASGAILVSLTNTGPYPVTILAATLNFPYQNHFLDLHAEPVQDTGQATYSQSPGPGSAGGGSAVAGAVLRPGEYMMIRLPVTATGCWTNSGSYVVISSFWVRFRFAFWTRLVQVSWINQHDQSAGAIITHEPEPASQGGICRY